MCVNKYLTWKQYKNEIGSQFHNLFAISTFFRVESTVFKPNIWELELDQLWLNYELFLIEHDTVSMITLEQKNVRA